MNSWQLAEDFRFVLAAAGVPNEWLHRLDQDEEKLTAPAYPAVIYSATAQPFSVDGKVGRFTLTAVLKSQAQTESAALHAVEVGAVQTYLFTQKAAIIAAVNARGNFTIIGYSAAEDHPGLEGNAFSTPVVIAGTARQL